MAENENKDEPQTYTVSVLSIPDDKVGLLIEAIRDASLSPTELSVDDCRVIVSDIFAVRTLNQRADDIAALLANDDSEFSDGKRVFHKVYGYGVVRATLHFGPDSPFASVKFANGRSERVLKGDLDSLLVEVESKQPA